MFAGLDNEHPAAQDRVNPTCVVDHLDPEEVEPFHLHRLDVGPDLGCGRFLVGEFQSLSQLAELGIDLVAADRLDIVQNDKAAGQVDQTRDGRRRPLPHQRRVGADLLMKVSAFFTEKYRKIPPLLNISSGALQTEIRDYLETLGCRRRQ